MPIPIFNEKALCALGAELKETGKLSETGRVSAMVNIGRFAEIAVEMELENFLVVATAAVREASNGPEFVAELERRFKIKIKTLTGDDEARLSALGVVSAFPAADGVMGDLGGGSLELVDIVAGAARRYASMPLGPLRLGPLKSRWRTAMMARIDEELLKLEWLDSLDRRPVYAVGGAWRSLARAHMTDTNYPLQVIHGYELGRQEALDFLDRISGGSVTGGDRVGGISVRRHASVALAALILTRVIRLGGASGIKFSAFGLREGCLFDQIADDEKARDPLLESCAVIAGKSGRFPLAPELVERWIRGFLPELAHRDARLVSAVAMLCDIGWAEHPRYRGEHAFLKVLRLPVVGIDHEDRAFVALAILARYQGNLKLPAATAISTLVPQKRRQDALRIGLAVRFGLTLCGGVGRLLSRIKVRPNNNSVSIVYPRDMAVMHGELVGRRLDDLSRAIGKPIVVEPVSQADDNDSGAIEQGGKERLKGQSA